MKTNAPLRHPRFVLSAVLVTAAFAVGDGSPTFPPASRVAAQSAGDVRPVLPGDPEWVAHVPDGSALQIGANNPRSGLGSIELISGFNGNPSIVYSKGPAGQIGTFGTLRSVSYEWLIDAGSARAIPPELALRVYPHGDPRTFFLRWNPCTTPGCPLFPTGAWHSTEIIDRLSVQPGESGNAPASLADIPPDAPIVDIHVRGIWDIPWSGFADNIALAFDGMPTVTFNFEVLDPAATRLRPSVSWEAPAAIPGGTPLSSAQLNAASNVPGTFTYSRAAGTVLPPDFYTLRTSFVPADPSRYLPASVTAHLGVTGQRQVLPSTWSWYPWGFGDRTAAITSANARGTGSLELRKGLDAASAYLHELSGEVLGPFGQLTSLSYDWFIDPASSAALPPEFALRVYHYGDPRTFFLIWDTCSPAVGCAPHPTGTWQSSNLIGRLVIQAAEPGTTPPPSLADIPGDAPVVGIHLRANYAFGQTWRGFVDQVEIGFNGDAPVVYDFEVEATGPDTTPPVITDIPLPLALQATGPSGAVVTWSSPWATDNSDGQVPVTCTPASGALFPVGTTEVTCTASDGAGNQASASFTVTVTPDPTVRGGPPFVPPTPPNVQAGRRILVRNTNDSGAGSLRAAFEEVNRARGQNYIVFNIPGPGPHVVALASPLPALQGWAVIDGTTEPDFAGRPIVELDGSFAGDGAVGLTVWSGGCVIRGLRISRFSGDGIFLTLGAGGCRIEGNEILNNSSDGIHVRTAGTVIGGTEGGAGNIIAGNSGQGIRVFGASAAGNTIQGNLVGILDGGTPRANGGSGVFLVDAPYTWVGGTASGSGNDLSHNAIDGVAINGSTAEGTRIQGNSIVSNGRCGVSIEGAPGSVIGGDHLAGAGNVIANNASDGIGVWRAESDGTVIQGNSVGVLADGTPAGNSGSGVFISAAPRTLVGGIAASNELSHNELDGIAINGLTARTTLVYGNSIRANRRHGVSVENAPGSQIGGPLTDPASGQLVVPVNGIESNGQDGVSIVGVAATDTKVRGNRILHNSRHGVGVMDARRTRIGGYRFASVNPPGSPVLPEGNVISGNGGHGIWLGGNQTLLTEVHGNFIGLGEDGVTALGNGESGIALWKAESTRIGNILSPEFANVISANRHDGILVWPAGGTTVEGNVIGLTVDGTAGRANGGTGVRMVDAFNTTVWGNTIAGHTIGIWLHGASTTGTIRENRLGTNGAGTLAIPNATGIRVEQTAGISVFDNTVSGGAVGVAIWAARMNILSRNRLTDARTAVSLWYDASSNQVRQGNVISGASVGIDVGGAGTAYNSFDSPAIGAAVGFQFSFGAHDNFGSATFSGTAVDLVIRDAASCANSIAGAVTVDRRACQ